MPACSTAASKGWNERELFDQPLQQSELLCGEGGKLTIVQALDITDCRESTSAAGIAVIDDSPGSSAGAVSASTALHTWIASRWGRVHPG